MRLAPRKTNTVKQFTESIQLLPPLPASAKEILTCFGDEYIDADKVAAVVERDPGICGKLLGLANSAYFGIAEPVNNIQAAISRVLGVDTVRSLVLAMAIQQSFKSNRCPEFSARRFWNFSLMTSECCARIAKGDKSASDAVRDLSSSTGLCHNLGLMALAHMEPEHTSAVLQAHRVDRQQNTLADRFRDEFGFDHVAITVELARHWSLPELMVSAYKYRAFSKTGSDNRLGQIAAAAIAIVGNSEIEEEQRIDMGEIASDLGMTTEEFQCIAMFSERQREKVESLSGNMSS